jgi:hypothetical protein
VTPRITSKSGFDHTKSVSTISSNLWHSRPDSICLQTLNDVRSVIFGVALHAASRSDTPDQLSALEKMLLDIMSTYTTLDELKAYGQLFHETKKTSRANKQI